MPRGSARGKPTVEGIGNMTTQKISVDFPYQSHSLDGSKIHYIDKGEGDPILG